MRHDLQINFGTRLLTIEQLTTIATDNNVTLDTTNHPNNAVFKGLDDWTAVEQAINNQKAQSTTRETDAFTSGFEWCYQYTVAK